MLGSPLQCIRCQDPNGCKEIKEIETCSEGNYTCANLTRRTTENNITSEWQQKGCLLKEECMTLKEKCDEILANGTEECEFSCCQKDFCNDDLNPDTVLGCFQCDGPFADGGLGLNSSSALNQSYTTSQCKLDEKKVFCPNGKCGRFYRRFENQENVTVEVYLRKCLSDSKCTEVNEFCREKYQNDTNTEICRFYCCDSNYCNNTSRGKFISFYNALVIMLILFHL